MTRGDAEQLPVLPVLSDQELPELPVLGSEAPASGVRALLRSLQRRHAEAEAEQPRPSKYRRPSALTQLWRGLRTRGPGWMASAVVHAVVLFITAQFVMFIRDPDAVRSILISLTDVRAEEAGQTTQADERGTDAPPAPAEEEPEPAEEPPAEPAPEPPSEPADAPAGPAEALPPANPPETREAAPQDAPPDESEAQAAAAPAQPAPVAVAAGPKEFHNRTGAGKEQALSKYGGSAETEAAVERGLEWLANHQHADGRWSGRSFANNCPPPDGRWAGRSVTALATHSGVCTGAGRNNYDVAHTALAALCFLGAGHLPGATAYGRRVHKALEFLQASRRVDGGFDAAGAHSCMYNHAIATLALCEAAALTHDEALRSAAQGAVEYLCAAQTSTGGWDYTGEGVRTRRSDMSISGWAVMALKSALVADLDVPRRTWDRARRFVRRSQRTDGEYAYDTTKSRFGPAMTAAGLVCDLYLGTNPESVALGKAATRVLNETPDWGRLTSEQAHTVYYWYYGTLAMFQRGGKSWHTWNTAMRTTLLTHQRTDGHAAGSWDPDGLWLAKHGGRVYATTLNILSLEVYYRYLPVYRVVGDSGKGGGATGEAEAPGALVPAKRPAKPSAYEVADADAALEKLKAAAPAMRAAAVERLGAEGSEAAFQAVSRALRDKNQMVRYAAVQVLATREEPEATWVLLRRFAAESRDMRRVIARALGKRGDQAAVPALIGALGDRDEGIHKPAAGALARITKQQFGTNARAWSRWWGKQQRK
ncbi:MAG: HEAT repeat domain-containing protein [Planctomycetota bacterium]